MKTRSFKLIKSYPNSENVGSVWKVFGDRYCYMNSSLDPADVEDNPEFFEEIIEKEYEILSVQNCLSGIILEFNKAGICIKRSDGCSLAATLSLGDCLKSGCKIFSIRRLSDNEVFSIGDKVIWGQTYIISHFNIHNDYLYVYVKHLERDDTFAVKYTDIKKI